MEKINFMTKICSLFRDDQKMAPEFSNEAMVGKNRFTFLLWKINFLEI